MLKFDKLTASNRPCRWQTQAGSDSECWLTQIVRAQRLAAATGS